MSAQLTERQTEVIGIVAKNNGFSDYEVINNPGSVKGDNFLGILTTVTIQNGKKKLDLILKSAHQIEAYRKAAPLREAYKREIYIYDVIFKEFIKFQEETNIENIFNCYPRLYLSSCEENHEFLLMENLKTQGYKLWDKKIPMNPGHMIMVLKEYAKLHATSLAMKEKKPKLFEHLTKSLPNIFKSWEGVDTRDKCGKFVDTIFEIGHQALEDEPDLLEFLQKIQSRVVDAIFDIMEQSKYHLVVVHADNWCNNFLFKYENPENISKPSNLRILDWQLSYLSSPAHDFSYFFILHCSKEMFADYKHYLHTYYDALAEQLRAFHCDPEELFPLSMLEEHLKIFMIYGVQMSLMLLKIMMCDSEDAPDFVSGDQDEDIATKAVGFKLNNLEGYKERLVNLLEFIKNNAFV